MILFFLSLICPSNKIMLLLCLYIRQARTQEGFFFGYILKTNKLNRTKMRHASGTMGNGELLGGIIWLHHGKIDFQKQHYTNVSGILTSKFGLDDCRSDSSRCDRNMGVRTLLLISQWTIFIHTSPFSIPPFPSSSFPFQPNTATTLKQQDICLIYTMSKQL
jgi:hypothetical protein